MFLGIYVYMHIHIHTHIHTTTNKKAAMNLKARKKGYMGESLHFLYSMLEFVWID